MKPRIYWALGAWQCNGVAGKTPREAYDNWRAGNDVWRFVPGGFVPRFQ